MVMLVVIVTSSVIPFLFPSKKKCKSNKKAKRYNDKKDHPRIPSPSEYAVLLLYGELNSLYLAIFSR